MIGVLGMSHLGIITSTGIASKGFDVTAFDQNRILIENLKKFNFPIMEPGLEELANSIPDNQIKFTTNLSELKNCELIFLAQDVNTSINNQSDTSYIETLLHDASKFISNQSCLVILCQVKPGFTRSLASKYKFKIVYQVETLIFGNAVSRFLNPERFIVGKSDENFILHPKHKQLLEYFDCPILEMNFESAELTKISINLFLASSITTTNALAEICEKIGAKWTDIVPALKLDPRIGDKSYLNPGLGISGGNIERDIQNIVELLTIHKLDNKLFTFFESSSRHRKLWPSKIAEQNILTPNQKPKVAVWGLTYKKNTKSTKNSPALVNISKLAANFRIYAHDPALSKSDLDQTEMHFTKDKMEALEGSDCLIIFTDWDEYRKVNVEEIKKLMKGNLIIDPYRILENNFALNSNFKYFCLGQSSKVEYEYK